MNIFDFWNRRKKEIDAENVRLFFHEQQIWWTQMGKNIGFEQDGKTVEFTRPVLILRKFNNAIFWGIPLSTRTKRGKYYFPFRFVKNIESVAILSQLRLFDAKRLRKKMGEISDEDFENLKKEITRLLNG